MRLSGLIITITVLARQGVSLHSQLHVRDINASTARRWNALADFAAVSLSPRQQYGCDLGEVECGAGCIPLSGVCCDGIKYAIFFP